MTLRGHRVELASRLSAVPDVQGWSARPVTPNVGDAWPMLGPGVRDKGTAFLVTWHVRVLVPQEEEAASDWWDLHWPDLFYALEPFGTVDGFEPIEITSSAGGLLAFQITLRTEE